MNSVGCAEVDVEAGHFDGGAGGAEDFSVGLNGDRWLVDEIRDWFADYAFYITVNCRCVGCRFAIAGSARAKKGFEGSKCQPGSGSACDCGQPEKGKMQTAARPPSI